MEKISFSNIQPINHVDLKDLLIRSFFKSRIPIFIHGTYGIGKSEITEFCTREIAKRLGLEFSNKIEDINNESKFVFLVIPLHQYDPAEIKGIPVRDGDVTKFLATEMLPQKGQGLLFLDEFNLAPPLVQANGYQLLLGGKLGTYVLPKDYYVVCAGNTDDDLAHNFEMAMPLKSRMKHCLLTPPTADQWIKNYAIPNGVDYRIIAFLSVFKQYIHNYNPDADNSNVYATANPRSWKFLSDSITGIDNQEILSIEVGITVGIEIAQEFLAFLSMVKEFDIDKIWGDKKIPDSFLSEQTQKKYALITALVERYKELSNKGIEEKDVHTLYELSTQFPEEFMYILIYLCTSFDTDLLKRIQDVLPNEEQKKFFLRKIVTLS